jgi:hypothetical protein
MPSKNSVGWVTTKDEYYNKIEDVLVNNQVDARNWLNIVVNHYDSSSLRIQEKLTS